MSFKIKKAGTFSDAGFVKRKSGATFVDVGFVKRKSGGVWVTVWPVAPPPPLVSITNQSIFRSAAGNTTAAYILNASGIVEKTLGLTTTTVETWLLSGLASDYEVRATLTPGGDVPSGTLNTWQALSATRSWSLQDLTTDAITLACTLTIEIRLTSSGVVQDTATIDLSSEKL